LTKNGFIDLFDIAKENAWKGKPAGKEWENSLVRSTVEG